MKKLHFKRTGLIIFCLGALLILASLIFVKEFRNKENDVIASVQQNVISQAELHFHMQRNRANVQNYFNKTYGISLTDDMWETKFGDETPIDKLKKVSMDECLKDKALLILAKKEGVIDYVDYQSFLGALEEENRSRAAALKKGEVVYGITNFTAEEYYGHMVTDVQTKLEKILSNTEKDPLYVSESEAKEYLSHNKGDWVQNATTYDVVQLFIPVKDETKRNDAYQQIGRAQQELKKGTAFETVCKKYSPTFAPVIHKFTNDTYSLDIRACYEIRNAAEQMQEGKTSDIINSQNGYSIILLKKKIFDQDIA